jgi:hypothetical protein
MQTLKQTGGKINKQLEKLNKQIDALGKMLF